MVEVDVKSPEQKDEVVGKRRGLTVEQTNRILHDFRRAAQVFCIMEYRLKELKVSDKILDKCMALAIQEWDDNHSRH